MRRDIDAVEQSALPKDRAPGFARTSRRAGAHALTRPGYRHDLAGDEPVEQVTNRGEPLLDTRCRELARAGLDPGGDVHRQHGGDRRHADAPAPGQEFFRGAGVGPARVRVADVGREEFEEAHAGTLAGGRDEGRECD
jgi:hypothetical protein